MSSNPYERRGKRQHSILSDGWDGVMTSGVGLATMDPALALEDVVAMAESVRRRVEVQTRRELDEQHQEALTEARRCAWDAGYAEGVADGRTAASRDIARAYGQQGIQAKVEAGDVIRKHRDDPRRVSKGELVATLERLHEALTAFWGQLANG